MSGAIGDVLPLSIAIALSPIAILATIVSLFTDRAKVTGLMFVAGWVAGLALIMLVAVVVADSANVDSDGERADFVSWAKVVFGVVLLGLAVREWMVRPGPGAETRVPPWFDRLTRMPPSVALATGSVLSTVSPKNLIIVIAAAAGISQANMNAPRALLVGGLFIAFSSVSVIAPVIAYLWGGETSDERLEAWRAWLLANQHTMTMLMFLVFGVILISKGLSPTS